MASHRIAGRKLSRYKDQRISLLRGLTVELILHERITTTLAKAKETRVVTEKLITHGKKGTLHHRRRFAGLQGGDHNGRTRSRHESESKQACD